MQMIFDVGAHKGEDTEFYLKKGFKVLAIEANPTLANELRDRFSEAIREGRLTVIHAAVADKDGEIEFFLNERSVFGTINPGWAERNEKMGARSTKVVVPAIDFRKLLREHGVPYYLKIDIEGADMLCVHALESVPNRPKYVSIESNKTSWRELVSEFDVLERLGYKRFKVVNQATIERQKEPNPAREGKYADH
ncbi:MAG TPA: FkbM family methyltransferase, partial [Verrucomicrobiota bacterium]|nr:FkbM family methyltransferase [Verrucomicrobiota bacterium]